MDLLHEIARCPNIQQWLTSPQGNNPCSQIISVQHSSHPQSLDQHQVPEPWSGDIQHAPILFLSSNPSIDEREDDEREEFPLWSWQDEWIEDFFTHRYKGGRKQWIENGTRYLQLNGSRGKSVSFWSHVRNRAKELLESDVDDGVDYVLAEVVHCKSRRETGVEAALSECAKRYLRRVVELSGAKVIVILGKHAKKAVRDEFSIPDGNMFGPLQIGKRQRYIAFLPHPNAHESRTFETRFDKERLQELRAFLNK